MGSSRRLCRIHEERTSMVVVKWHEYAWQLFNDHVDFARYEFGRKTSEKWIDEMVSIDKRLRLFPESFSPEPLLCDRKVRYRSCLIMKRFKIVYFYEQDTDTVYIVDIWDSLQNPKTLTNRL